jgi:hypothetical protein
MADAYVMQGARRPILGMTLVDANGPVNLTSASSIAFRGRLQDGTTVFSGSATADSPAAGHITYTPGANDFATPGTYIVEAVVTWDTGITQGFPTDRIATLLVRDAAS